MWYAHVGTALRVEELPIPEVLRDFVVRERGVKELYPPQAEAVKAGIFEGANIVM